MPTSSLRRAAAPLLPVLAAFALALCGLAPISPAAPAEPPHQAPVKLAVLVVFDQMRGDYLTRWDGLFGDGGFHRLEKDGAWFQDCRYPYAYTVTAAGHASIATGTSAYKHGIIENDWYDRDAAASVSCVGSERYGRVPPPPADPTKDAPARKPKGVSPERLMSPTLADALKKATGGAARVVSLSLKDRAAVLPGGRRPDACYWLDLSTGEFVTSTYYRERPHAWVEEFNKARRVDQWLGKDWTRLLPDLDYEKYSGPDDVAGEGVGASQGRTFPHPTDGGKDRKPSAYYAEVYDSPDGNELLLALAERAIDAEGLGGHDAPDLLCLSFSSNDAVGHTWGPDSQEVLDVTLRSDRVVRELLDRLDEKVGMSKYVLAMTADHGVCPLPEVSRKQGKDAGRVDPSVLRSKAEAFLDDRFGGGGPPGRWVEATEGPWVYLNNEATRRRGLKEEDVQAALADWLPKQDGIQAAYTRIQLAGELPEGDAVGRAVRRSFYPGRSGDLFVVLKPYHLLSSPLATGTNHGTPHEYDTHVPLLVFGSGIRPGARKEAVTPQATAAILAKALGIDAPSDAEAPVPEGLFSPTPP